MALDFLITTLILGAGATIVVASKLRHLNKFKQIGLHIKQLAKAMKKKASFKRQSGQTGGQVDMELSKPDNQTAEGVGTQQLADGETELAESTPNKSSTPSSRQRELEVSIAAKRIVPESLADAKRILKKRRKELLENGYKPKYTDEELLYLASKGEVNDRYIVRTEWDKNPEQSLGYTRDSGRAPIWTTTFDQIEHADSDPELITNILGFDQPFNPNDKYKMYIIDQGEDFITKSDLSIVPSYEKLGDLTKAEMRNDRGFDAELVDKVMTPEYSEKHAKHMEDFSAQTNKTYDEDEIANFTASMNPDEKSLFKTRHRINTEFGANPLYSGNGLTKPYNNIATQSEYGVLEVFTFQRKPRPTGELIEAGKLAKLPLPPLTKGPAK